MDLMFNAGMLAPMIGYEKVERCFENRHDLEGLRGVLTKLWYGPVKKMPAPPYHLLSGRNLQLLGTLRKTANGGNFVK